MAAAATDIENTPNKPIASHIIVTKAHGTNFNIGNVIKLNRFNTYKTIDVI